MSISFLRILSLLAAIPVLQHQYGCDKSGNRQSARVQQATIGATAHDNDRSYLYGYDDLQRLIQADLGMLDNQNQAVVANQSVALARFMDWNLDSLGNWVGPSSSPNLTGFKRQDDTDADGSFNVTTNIDHTVDSFNKITQVKTNGNPVAHVNDSAGNLVFDGVYVYQYDAWNRLVEVNEADSLTTADFAPDGKINPTTGHHIGVLVVRFAYDGVGRLMLAQRPVDPQSSTPPYRTEHYYYDGVRRVQEVIQTPGTTGGDQFETAHEYVYGPDYVDEFVVESQKTTSGQQDFYILQDANYNVMALTDGTGGVLEQYQWEPYGALATKDTAGSPAPHSHIGHQGLFFYRFDDATAPPIALNAVGLYHNRNRWYSPSLGRFMSRDPNETALLLNTALAKQADDIRQLLTQFDPEGHYLDGMNLSQYLGSNPVESRDPFGLNASCGETVVVSGTLAVLMTIGGGIVGEQTGAFDAIRYGIMGMTEDATELFFAGIALYQAGTAAVAAAGAELLIQTAEDIMEMSSRTRKLGPSGKPMIHRIKCKSRKAAKDAARDAGRGEPMHHPRPRVGRRHYHPTDGQGRKIPDGTHYEY